MQKKQIILILTFAFCIITHAQSVLTWQQVNTDEHELPWSTQRLNDGNILMAAIRHTTFTSKHKLLLLKINADGNPTKQKEISFTDTSINTTGGIFMLNDTQLIVFATFALDPPYFKAKYWGYIIVDTAFNYLKCKINLAPFALGNDTAKDNFCVDFIRTKQNETTKDFYGTLVLKTPSYPFSIIEEQSTYNRYNTYFIFNKNLELLLFRVDTVYQFFLINTLPPYDTTYYSANIMMGGCGDMLLLNDSNYITLSENYHGFIYTKMKGLNYTIDNRFGFDINLDTIRNLGIINFDNPYFLLTKWTNNSFLLSGTVSQNFYDQVNDTTDNNYLTISNIGQSAIAIMDSSGKVKKFTFLTACKYDLNTMYITTGEEIVYNPPVIKNLDYIDKNKIYYASTCDDDGFWSPFYDSPSHVIVIKVDSNLNRTWIKHVGDTGDHLLVQYAYNIVATNDGGCMIFCRKRARFFSDPYFKSIAPEWNIAVYKVSEDGVVKSTKEINFEEPLKEIIVYPNPANQNLYFKGLTEKATIKLFDTNGKLILEKSIDQNNPTIELTNFSTGLYFYSVFSSQTVIKNGKVLVEH